MSLFLNNSSIASQDISDERMELAEVQYDALVGLLNTIQKSCGEKCIPLDYGEGELNKGESVCINRCVAKFMQSHKVIGNFVETGMKFTDKDMKHYEYVKAKYLNKTE